MYAYIEGTLESVDEDSVIIDNHGIGYEIFLPTGDLSRLPARGETVRIYTYFQAGENGVALYGFLSREEKQTFTLLLGVNGVGPRAALSILGTISAEDLKFAILSDDSKAISQAPGVGPKTAKRIILDLKDKLDIVEEVGVRLENGSGMSDVQLQPSVKNDAVAALTALGYNGADALNAIKRIGAEDIESLTVEEVLKLALKELI